MEYRQVEFKFRLYHLERDVTFDEMKELQRRFREVAGEFSLLMGGRCELDYAINVQEVQISQL